MSGRLRRRKMLKRGEFVKKPWRVREIPGQRDRTFATEAEAHEFIATHGGVLRWNQLQTNGAPRPVKFSALENVPPAVRRAVRARSGGRCEIRLPECTLIATQQHHRQKRPVGPHTEENLIDSCSNCHQFSEYAIHASHGRNEKWAHAVGLLVTKNGPPPSEPWDRERMLLSAGAPLHPITKRKLLTLDE